MKIDEVRLSEMLLTGYVKAWSMIQVLDMSGVRHATPSFAAEVHSVAQFMPPGLGQYAQPVRAFVAVQWPKLNAYLLAHEHDWAAVIKVAPQLRRLKSRDRWVYALSSAEAKEITKTRRDVRAQRAASRAIRSARESLQRSAWKVCK